jgi:hypothetical protein
MDRATQLWAWWLSVLSTFAPIFTRPGWVRFVQWVTGMVLGWEEHTLTQILTALGLESRWRVLEGFAEYGAWDREAVERQTVRLLEPEHPARWGPYHPIAIDDTKLHRTSKQVWGTCTFHESSARSPNRAETVRAHNWVEMGDLAPGRPWTYRPHAARLYCRQNQLPAGDTFRTKTALAVELLRQADTESAAPLLGVFDGAYAVDTVIRPCLARQEDQRRIEIITRLRADARLYHPLVVRTSPQGRRPVWGPRMATPQHHLYWPVSWQRSRVWVYGRRRSFQYQQLRCRWAVSGPEIPMHVLVVQMAGYAEPWFLVTSALALSAAQVVAAWTARFRQEDGFRDHQQRLGMEECRAWTKEPILRTFQVQLVAMTLLRLRQTHLDQAWGTGSWWGKPEWNRRKRQASILDLRRLFWRYRTEFSQFLVYLEEMENIPQPPIMSRDFPGRAA